MHRRSSDPSDETDASFSPDTTTGHGDSSPSTQAQWDTLPSQIAAPAASLDFRPHHPFSAPRSRNSSAVRSSFSPSPSHASTTPPTPASTKLPASPAAADMIPLASWQPSIEGSPEAQRGRQFRLRSPWSVSILSLSTALAGVFFFLFIMHSFMRRPLGADGCQTPLMSPTYLKMLGFDAEHTRFASKYNLYLYREEGVDYYSQDNIGLSGAPVLFLPGNAGSYKQVRSLASEASRHYRDVVQQDGDRLKAGARNLDFFMVDFNEDLAAFHGQTILDQAEYVNEALTYILSLYHDPRRLNRDPSLPDPSSVILIGHSMGGIVARTVLTMANYQANSVNTIITMSTPHAKPPVSFDSDIVHTYKQINDYWRAAYSQEWANYNPLWHVTLISIAGGARDTIVGSDYASLASLVPETHGFTVFTSTIPDVWVGTDHLSITWCDQFRKAVIKSIFEVVDVHRSSQTRPRAERMRIFKKWFLTGMEPTAERTLPQQEPNTLLTLDSSTNTILSQGERLVLRGLGNHKESEAHLIPVPPQGVPGKKFTLLTDRPFDRPEGDLEVLFCAVYPLQAGRVASYFSMNLDFSRGESGSTRLACKNAAEDRIHLPASTSSSQQAFDNRHPFSYLQYDLEDLSEHQFVAVIDKAQAPSNGWVVAEFSDSSDAVIPTRVGLGRLLSAGLHVKLPANRPMLTEVKIPSLHSSLLAYKLSVRTAGCSDPAPLFSPLLRQSMPEPHESKFFVNLHDDVNVNLHGVAPYMPPPLREQAAYGVSFHLWSDPTCSSSVDLSLAVNIPNSLGELVMRYRTVFAPFPLLVVALVLRKQFKVYDDTGYFITFMESLNLCLRSSLPVLLGVLSLLASSLASTRRLPPSDDPFNWRKNSTESVVDFTKYDLLLGAQDAFFWFLVPLFGLISIGLCVAINYVSLLILTLLSSAYGMLRTKTGYIRRDDRGNLPIFSHPSPRRRIINCTILLILVATVIPYQFAYIVACLVQIATCVRALWHFRETRLTLNSNFFNYAHSILTLMLWVLPINILVLVVWVHNLAVHWLTPFSSHHNVLSIMPFLILVETMTSGHMIPRIFSRVKHVTYTILFCLAGYSAVYGVSYAYLLHHVANIFSAWLVAIYLVSGGFSIRRIFRILQGNNGDENNISMTGLSDNTSGKHHVKKKP
ncbi:putative GPI maturation protein [Talaromyces proteolyticus]|uniref:GPI inositol-deacylase n=1 Tax=Talaromyces proteolyticus TaxID=1131652 RepID=A0AAD4Q729_9EURO|nr:putative GPI maturation protein [Talaromyces proteolyticus]KAH8705927.1 putative GPI maturation protein [Talaromyces proteolyticus]